MDPQQFDRLLSTLSEMSSPSWIDITNIFISALGLIVIVLAAASLFVANRQLKVMQEQTKKSINSQDTAKGGPS